VAVTAASYETARSTSFFQSSPDHRGWSRTRRIGVPGNLHLNHLMASIAVPMIFPPQLLSGGYFGDGAMRQATPLSSAVHLGADRILVVGVRDETVDEGGQRGATAEHPSFGQIAGYMLDTLFMDGLYSDLERMTRINQLVDSVPEEQRTGVLKEMRPLDTMVVVPSEDLRDVAFRHRKELPVALRVLLRGIGGRGHRESEKDGCDENSDLHENSPC